MSVLSHLIVKWRPGGPAGPLDLQEHESDIGGGDGRALPVIDVVLQRGRVGRGGEWQDWVIAGERSCGVGVSTWVNTTRSRRRSIVWDGIMSREGPSSGMES